jgi:hypothetical protein
MALLRSLLLILVVAAVPACVADPALPAGDAEYVGTLTEFLHDPASASVRVLVERPGAPAPGDRAIVYVGAETDVRILEGDGAARKGTAADLAANDELRVWTTGVELRSYPVQVFALRIHIIR